MPMDADRPLLLVGRTFEGFTKAFDAQFACLPGLAARHELSEITTLEDVVLHSDSIVNGDVDLMLIHTDWLPALIESGRILALDNYLEGDPPSGWPEAYVESLRTLQQGKEGRTYGIPYHDGPIMLLYRSDLYADPTEQAGFQATYGYRLQPAITWSQFVDQASWFDRPAEGLRGTVFAGFPDQHNNIYDFLTHLWSRGGELITAGESGLGSQAASEAIQFLYDVWHRWCFLDPAAAGWDSVASGEHFAAGEAAIMVNWCGFASMSADPSSATNGRVACTTVPAGDGPQGQVASMNAYYVLAIPTGCTRPDDAYVAIRALAAPDMDVLTATSGATATRRDTWARAEIQALAPYYEQQEAAHQAARAVPRRSDWPQMAAILDDMMAAVVSGSADPVSLLREAHQRLSGLLATAG